MSMSRGGAGDPVRPADGVRRAHPVWWVIAAGLLLNAAGQFIRTDGSVASPAWAQVSPGGGGQRGVFAFSGQLASGVYGVYMVDVDSMTMWCYEYQKERGCMRLAAARSWKYDRYLEQHNVCDITPADVERLIEDQRAYHLQNAENGGNK
ncbi:MAG: hypothetical protein BroJett003_07340 [Planctomycetota bacterium]|nr:MAG: hypothetical protein BroJett003_07340 [Planctomycetota bacterium]